MRSTKDFDGVENMGYSWHLYLLNWEPKSSVFHCIWITSVKHCTRENSGNSEGEHCCSLWLFVDPQTKSQSSSHPTGMVLIVISRNSSHVFVSVFPFALKPVCLHWNGPSCSFKS